MLLNPYMFKKKQTEFVNEDSIRKANIVFHKREIYIIKMHQTKDANTSFSVEDSGYQNNFVILINYAKIKSNYGEELYIKNTYGFMYLSGINNAIKEFKDANLLLQYATSTGYRTFSEYYKDDYYEDLGYSFIECVDMDPFEICIDDLENDSEIVSGGLRVPDPRYYTVNQYEIDTREEFNNIISKGIYTIKGANLIDNATTIKGYQFNNTAGYDDSIKFSNGKGELLAINVDISGEYIEKIIMMNEIPLNIYTENTRSFIKSYKFIYDSNLSYRIRDILLYKDTSEYRSLEYVKEITEKMLKISKNIEKTYGRIRLLYSYSEIEDSIYVSFDDSNENIRYNNNKRSTFERVASFLYNKYERHYARHKFNYLME